MSIAIDIVTSRSIMNAKHPLNAAFVKFLAGKPATKRQAAKFLQRCPQFRRAISVAA